MEVSNKIVIAGGTGFIGNFLLKELENAFWGDQHCRLADPDGYEWGFATHLS